LEGNDVAGKPERSWLQFLADLGNLIAQYCTDKTYAILVVIVAWILSPIGALIASLLIASIYLKAKIAKEPGAPATEEKAIEGEKDLRSSPFLILLGLILVAIGGFWLIKEYVEIHWYWTLIVIGAVLIIIGYLRRPKVAG